MSEKNRKKSKANKVLKAVGTAGIVFGAATIDANVVFAAELDNEVDANLDSDSILSQLEDGSQSETESIQVSESGAPSDVQKQGGMAGDDASQSQADVQPAAGGHKHRRLRKPGMQGKRMR